MDVTNPLVTSAINPANPEFGVLDALYRFGLAQDIRHEAGARDLFESAFTENAVLDFRPAAQACGIDVPIMVGRDMITSIILNPSTRIDTTHVITNGRVNIEGEDATLTALVEAQHLPSGDHTRHSLLKNFFSVTAVRDGELWRMNHVHIRNIWHTGDANVITGN